MSGGIGVVASGGDGADVPPIGVGMLGYAFMGKAHANAYRKLAYMTWPPPLMPRLVSIAGRDEPAVAEAARRYGFERHVTDWHELVADPEVELFDNTGPNNLHAEPTIAAAEAGKHVFCEKPLGRTADESYEIWQRVAAAGVKHMTAFNYRFVPAVRLARELIERGSSVRSTTSAAGTCRSGARRPTMRGASTPTPPAPARSVISARTSSISRATSSARSSPSPLSTRTFMPGREVDDAFDAVADFADGAVGTIGATRFAPAGRTRSAGRSTARRARSHSTSSG